MRYAIFFLTAIFAVPPVIWGVSTGMLISTDALSKRLADDSLVILHVGSQKDYDAGHIPGARLINLSDISVTGERGLRVELPPVEALVAALGKLGIGDTSKVVIYPATEAVQAATRVWFTFDYLGLGDRVALLDGGLSLWRAEGRPLSTELPNWEAKTLKVRPRPELVVDAAWVHSHANDPSVRIVDARTPDFYSGANAGEMPRAGRIPGAHNAPLSSFLEENRRFKPEEQLKKLLGAPQGSLPVTYCHIGQQATVPYFVARYLGMQPRLYDGSFQDWSRRSELPVETGEAKR
jgi:thiosulfate/3-mercaptopyruvate sulfurtransferase